MRGRLKKRVLSLVLAMTMLFSCMTNIAYASEMATRPSDGQTTGQPFPAGTGGSANFRIPCLVTLDNGTIVTACDARWNHQADALGLDTIVSRSTDRGQTWNYTFANYLGDNGNKKDAKSTAFIDPALATDGETVWMIADLYPAGIAINTVANDMLARPGHTGYDENHNLVLAKATDTVNGLSPTNERIAQPFEYTLVKIEGAADTDSSYYNIIDKDGNVVEGYEIDAFFNIKGENVNTNLFVGDSPYFPWPTDFLYMTKSTDGGATWSIPTLIDVKRADEQTLLVGPGRGIVTTLPNGTERIIFTAYDYTYTDDRSCAIYSDDGGKTWTRGADVAEWSSESVVTEADGKLYLFTRHGRAYYVSDNYGESWGPKRSTGLTYNDNCQLTAITYSEKVNGKTAILLAAPSNTSSRSAGKMYLGLVQEDGTISWENEYSINGSAAYAYSCIDELLNGNIALLYEHAGAAIAYKELDINQIAQDAVVGNIWFSDEEGPIEKLEMKPGQSVTLTVGGLNTNARQTVTVTSDNEAVTAEIVGDQVTLQASASVTGLKKATVTVEAGEDKNSIQLYVVSEDRYKIVELSTGEKASFTDFTGNYEDAVDLTTVNKEVAQVEIVGKNPDPNTVEVEEATLMLGTDKNFTVKEVPIASALFNVEARFELTATTASGEKVYLQPYSNNKGYPNVTTGVDVTFEQRPSTEYFYVKGNGGYLYFNDGKFDRVTATGSFKEACSFMLYEAVAEGGVGSTEIPGFVKVLQPKAGGQYLIVAERNQAYYVVYPSKATSNSYAQVAKVTGESENGVATVQLGNSAAFDGEKISAAQCIYTNKRYNVISGKAEDGSTVYVNVTAAKVPTKSEMQRLKISKSGSVSGSFLICQEDNANYLHFHTEVDGYYFNKCSGNADEGKHSFAMFKKAETASWNDVISGYVQVTDLEEILSGGQFLIAVKAADNNYYVLNPTKTATNTYSYTGKVKNFELPDPTTDILITAGRTGQTSVVVNGITYHIIVENEIRNITLEEGETYNIPGEVFVQPEPTGIVAAETIGYKYERYAGSAEQFTGGKFLIGKGVFIMQNEADKDSGGGLEVTTIASDNPIEGDYDAYMWTFTPVTDGYRITDTQGRYLGFNNGTLVVGSDAQVFTVVRGDYGTGDGFGISNGSYFLNNYGGDNNNVTGYSLNDGGSNMYLYQLSEKRTTITAEQIGKTELTVGSITYVVNVTARPVGTVDYTDLDAEIAFAEALIESGQYVDHSVEELREVLERAKTLERTTEKFYDPAELAAAQEPVDALVEELVLVISHLHKLVHSTAVSVGEVSECHAVEGETAEIEYDRSIAEITFDGEKMLVKGISPGIVKVNINHVTHYIVVSAAIDDFPIYSKTGEANGKRITKLTISADNSYKLAYQGKGTVEWSTPEVLVNEEAAVTLETVSDGVIVSFNKDEIEENILTTVTATVKDENGTVTGSHTIPVVVHPQPKKTVAGVALDNPKDDRTAAYNKGDNEETVNLYLEEITNTHVFYSWDCSADLVHASEGEAIYVSYHAKENRAIDFMGEPYEGYALNRMAATNTLNHYMTIHTGDYKTLDRSNKGFLNYTKDGNPGAGKQQYAADMFGLEVESMLYAAMDKGCDGVMGMTRYGKNLEADIAGSLTFQASKLPTIEKSVFGILPANGKRAEFRLYEDGMSAGPGEFVYFEVEVTTYRPVQLKNDNKSVIEYSNVILSDTKLSYQENGTWHGASFIHDYGADEKLDVDEIIPNPAVVSKDLTNHMETETWSAGEETKTHKFYVAYQMKDSDLGKDIINVANLTYDYHAIYSTGTMKAEAHAEADIAAANYVAKNIITDFGLPVTVEYPLWTTVDESGNAKTVVLETGIFTEAAKYGTVEVKKNEDQTGWLITYTPTSVLQGIDVVTLSAENDEELTFRVYPANSVYYEEKFIQPIDVNGWAYTENSAALSQEAALPGATQATENPASNFGYDAAYEGAVTSEMHTILPAGAQEKASFRFTGTGVDIYTNCDKNTGVAMVLVKQLIKDADGNETSSLKKLITVNAVKNFGDLGNGNAILTNDETIYNIPIVSIPEGGLPYGNYEVVIVHVPQKGNDAYLETELRLDGFRVYGVLGEKTNERAASLYNLDKEAIPVYVEMRDSVLANVGMENYKGEYADEIAKNTMSQIYASASTPLKGVTLIGAGDGSVVTGENLEAYLSQGPKNELYVYPGQSMLFKLAAGVTNPQLAFKSLNGTTDYQIYVNGTAIEEEPITLNSNTEMYYSLNASKTAETAFTITNIGEGVLSVTKLKYSTYESAPEYAFATLAAGDLVPALMALGFINEGGETPEETKDVTKVYADVQNDWYTPYVQYVYDKGIMTGSNGLFNPLGNVTRAQVVNVLYRMEGSPEVTDYTACEKMNDLDQNEWYADAVCWAYANGIAFGNDVTKMFAPNDSVTRQQLSAFMYRYAEYKGMDVSASADISGMLNADKVSEYAQKEVKWAVAEGIISGSEITNADGTTVYDLKPEATATRAQMASILQRFCEKQK